MKTLHLSTAVLVVCLLAQSAGAVTLTSVGIHNDVGTDPITGDAFFPGGEAPYQVVRWRDNDLAKPLDLDGDNVYGTAGYINFATQFNFPNQACCGGRVDFNAANYPNLVELPSFVSASLNLTATKVGGWNYALIDDPRYVDGEVDTDWHTSVAPAAPAEQQPYVKLGILDGDDVFGNNPQTSPIGAGRWAFEVGDDVPSQFRVGVMVDGLDAPTWAAGEVLLAQSNGSVTMPELIGLPVSSGPLDPNRFVDMVFFDIVDAQPGEVFAIFAKSAPGGLGGISGVTFDLPPTEIPEPGSLAILGLSACGVLAIRSRSKSPSASGK